MANGLFKIKSVAALKAEAETSVGLKRTLGPFDLVALGIGAIIGAGLFVRTAAAAANNAGPSVTLGFVVAALGCAFAGLCYAEFASMIPMAGSAYTYAYATMGELVAWIIGWDLVLEYAIGAATVGIAWSEYLVKLLKFLGIQFPYAVVRTRRSRRCTTPRAPCRARDHERPGAVHRARAEPAPHPRDQRFGVRQRPDRDHQGGDRDLVHRVRLGVHQPGESHPVHPAERQLHRPPGVAHHYGGLLGILGAAGVVFFAFIGFDAVSTAAQEAKNPQRDMPIGILGSLAICTVLYILFAHVLTGVANVDEFRTVGKEASVAYAIMTHMHGYDWLAKFVTVAILAGFSSVILVMLLGQSRVFYSMSHDGLVPKVFSDVHPKFGTPWKSNLIFFVFVGAFAAFLPEDIVGDMTSIGTLFAFILVCAGVWILRRRPRAAARVPHAAGAAGPDPGDRRLRGHDFRPRLDELGTARRLARDRPRDLLRLRPKALQAAKPPLADA